MPFIPTASSGAFCHAFVNNPRRKQRGFQGKCSIESGESYPPTPPNKDAIHPHRKQWGILSCFRNNSQENLKIFSVNSPIHTSLLPLSVLFIIVSTSLPLELQEPSSHYISWDINLLDVIINVIIYLPIGIALSGWKRIHVIIFAGFLSCLSKTSQLISIDRYAGIVDVFFNVLGAMLGSFAPNIKTVFFRLDKGVLAISSKSLIAISSLCAVTVIAMFLIPPKGVSDFSNWDPHYQIAVADELTRDRPWSGRLLAWAIFDQALDSGFIRQFKKRPLSSDFMLPIESMLLEPILYEKTTGADHRLTKFATLSPDQSQKIYEALSKTNTMSLVALFWTDNIQQNGPGRIITQSVDPFHRNFTLGQEGKRAIFRLRTPMTGLNGLEPEVQSSDVLQPRQLYLIVATYDGFVSRLFINGELTGTSNLAVLSTKSAQSAPLLAAGMNECLNQPPQWGLIQGPNDGKMTTWLSEERRIPSMIPNTIWCGRQNTVETSCVAMCSIV